MAGALPAEVPGSAKLCAALDGMVRVTAALRKAQALGVLATLAKTSRNVKEQRANITREQANARRERYARTLGLVATRKDGPLRQEGNQINYGIQSLEHELGHAMHAKLGEMPRDHVRKLDVPPWAPPREQAPGRAEEDRINNSLEYKLDRRAGVDPQRFGNPKGLRGLRLRPVGEYGEREDSRTVLARPWSHEDADDLAVQARHDQKSRKVVARFDAGARFDGDGRLRAPQGIDARINTRAQRGGGFRKGETMYCSTCKDPLDGEGHCKIKAHWPALDVSKVERPGQAAPPAPTNAPVAPVGPKPPERRNRLPQRPKVPSGQGLAGQTGGAK